jgi:acetyltransferase-like isoleucine patch superfamily enzyme
MLDKILRPLIEAFLRPIDGGLGEQLRYRYYRRRLKACGANVRIGINVRLTGLEHISVGDDVWIDDGCILNAGLPNNFGDREVKRRDNPDYGPADGALRLGSYIHVAPGCILNAFGGGIEIGDHCGLSSGVKIYSMSNHYRSFEDPTHITYSNPMTKRLPVVLSICPVKMGRNCFVTLGATLLGGTLGENSYVTPGALVVGRFAPNSILSGSPARVRGPRFLLQDENRND